MTDMQSRVTAGVPAGGRYTERVNRESPVTLGGDAPATTQQQREADRAEGDALNADLAALDAALRAAGPARARAELRTCRRAADGILRQWPDAVYLEMGVSDQGGDAMYPVAVLDSGGQVLADDLDSEELDNGAYLPDDIDILADGDGAWTKYREYPFGYPERRMTGRPCLDLRAAAAITDKDLDATSARIPALADPVSNLEPGQVSAADPAVQVGQVFDTVVDEDGTVFHRRRAGIYPGIPYAMRFQASRPISDDEMRQFAGLVGYAYRSTVAGKQISDPQRASPYSFTVRSDMTKTRRDDLGMALDAFEEGLASMVADGSPVRKTDRAGSGTAGTRLVAGLGGGLRFETYYDDVYTGTG